MVTLHKSGHTGDQTELSMRLRLPETRPTALLDVLTTFVRVGTLPATAAVLHVGERTLKRLVSADAGLAAAITVARAQRAAVHEQARHDLILALRKDFHLERT